MGATSIIAPLKPFEGQWVISLRKACTMNLSTKTVRKNASRKSARHLFFENLDPRELLASDLATGFAPSSHHADDGSACIWLGSSMTAGESTEFSSLLSSGSAQQVWVPASYNYSSVGLMGSDSIG
jgi:hypothetical protein